MAKTVLTPGRLYARLSAEFGRLRLPECAAAHMPMVYMIERRLGNSANWVVDDLPRGYEQCQGLVDEIVGRYSLQYDIFDPTCTPVALAYPRAPALPSTAPGNRIQ
jgi:hypothetical protein